MSTLELRRPRTDPALSIVVVVAGIAFMVTRSAVGGTSAARLGFVTAGFLALAAASISVPVVDGPSDVTRSRGSAGGFILVGGIAAVVLATRAAGTPVPVAWGAFAPATSVLAAVAEEALFRRVAYARLQRFGPAVAILGSAMLFAIVHLPLSGTTTLPVDAGAALLFSWQRWASGTWTVPAATHAFANLVAVLR